MQNMKRYPRPNELVIDVSASIRQAMSVLDQFAMQIVLVADEQNVLKGVVTDGDIRRALLAGNTLESAVTVAMNVNPAIGQSNVSENAWRQVMKKAQCRHLPIVDSQNCLVELIYDKATPIENKPNCVVLMLGGLGMRLRPLTESIPKPLIEVGGKPILETIVERFSEQGFNKFIFCINYLGHQIRDHFGDGSDWGVQIDYIEETKQLGTAGALSLLEVGAIEEPFIVMNGDLLTKVDFTAFIELHRSHKNSITVGVREYSHQVPYGVIELESDSVSQIVEKPVYSYFVNAGIYSLAPDVLRHIPFNKYLDMPNLIELVMDKKHKVGAFPVTEYWKDIGQYADFEQAQMDYEVHFSVSKED